MQFDGMGEWSLLMLLRRILSLYFIIDLTKNFISHTDNVC